MYEVFATKAKEKGVNAYQVAKATGLSHSMFSDWKHGRYTPKADKLIKLAKYFECDVMDFYQE